MASFLRRRLVANARGSDRRTRSPAVTEDAPVDLADDVLTQEEKELCQQVVVFGLEYLRQAKSWRPEAIKRFVMRPGVRTEIETVKKQYEDRTGIQERTQFLAQLKVNSMVPAAMGVLARTLRGAVTDPGTGNVTQPPSRGQYEAALQVLERANIQGGKWAGNDRTPSIDMRSVNVAIGGGTNMIDGLTSEGREKVRGLLNRILSRTAALSAADAKISAREVSAVVHDEPSVRQAEDVDGEA
jgi:hypothetical protein